MEHQQVLTFPNSTAVMTLWTIFKINTIRDQTVTVQPSATVSHQIVHFRSHEEQFHSFSTIGEEELYKLVKSAKPTTWMLDPFPSKILKEVLPEVIDPLLAIINSSLSLEYVPKKFKLAVIKPLIKKHNIDPKDLVNYRPISNLPFLSKIIEKVASSQLYSFLEKNDICEDFQSGFKPPHSTETDYKWPALIIRSWLYLSISATGS